MEWEDSATGETSPKTWPETVPEPPHHDGRGRINHYQPDQEPAAIPIDQITQN